MDDFADAGCEHFYAYSSPSGSERGIGICVYCYMPDPEELDRLAAGGEALLEALRRARRAAEQLTLMLPHKTGSESDRIAGKIEGVRLVESYLSEELRMIRVG